MNGRFVVRPSLALLAITIVLIAAGSIGSWADEQTTAPSGVATFTISRPKVEPFTFPGNKRTIFPNFRVVALYGSPSYPVLGALGQQDIGDSIAKVRQLAGEYKPFSNQPILPAFEIIATVASASPTANNDYSQETDVQTLLPWVEAARASGIYVVLDMQPGRSDFLTQAKEYESLLVLPNVGLALDPEWRLAPNQLPLAQIGSVDASEINSVASWLAGLVIQGKLPQKLFVVHQFRLSMISNRADLATNFPELSYVIQMDGQGTPSEKNDTYSVITASTPPGLRFGWKNFYQKDSPMLTPAETMAVNPQPWYISYQ